MKQMKKWLLALVAIVATLSLVACSKSSKASQTREDQWKTYENTKAITIGFDNTFVPMGFEDEDGKTVGFDIDLANAVFAKYGITVNWQPINWDMKENELTNGNIDLIWNGYTVSDERAKKVLFSDSYMVSEQVLVTKKDAGITSVKEMSGKVLGAQAGSSSYDEFVATPEVLKDQVKDNEAVLFDTFTQAFMDLEAGRIDALLVDNVYANYYLNHNGDLDKYMVFSSGLTTGDFAVGARPADKTLVANINQAFKDLYKDGTYQKISDKWFGEDTATDVIKN